MTRQEIIAGFHKLYIENIAKETKKRGVIGAAHGGGIPMERVKEIFDDTVAEYYEELLTAHAGTR